MRRLGPTGGAGAAEGGVCGTVIMLAIVEVTLSDLTVARPLRQAAEWP
jgi:hypothetical protein